MSEAWNIVAADADRYLQACREFVEDDEKFAGFKQDQRYKVILEHVSAWEATVFMSEMKNLADVVQEEVDEFRENDSVGGALVEEFRFFGAMSPSTVRYIKNTLDIADFLGDEELSTVVEIGGGYGGMCKTLSVMFDFDNYFMADLPDPLALAMKYLSHFPSVADKAKPWEESVDDIDLVISTYAFSECSIDVQLEYYEKVLKKAKRFYMVYNNICQGNLNSEAFIKLASKDFKVTYTPEVRPSFTNYVIYGTKL